MHGYSAKTKNQRRKSMQNPIVQQVVETLRGANNVLITVKNSPSVDELTAAIALTLILNHMNKHATTVFSGQVPSTIEFLQPEMAIESTTDSLRDFIIALDKAKADKLRYKVEDNVVRIFITPYRSSISEEDLEFSQGDFNVDVVLALGVLSKEDFDEAIMAHGQILHDATVVAINNQAVPNEVGAVSWQDQQASSISEMIASISDLFGAEVIDSQIATALMTGIVAETDRFKNEKTTPQVLSVSSMLMSAGANQQLIAEKLEHGASEPPIQPLSSMPSAQGADDGTLSVDHTAADESVAAIDIDEHGNIAPKDDQINAASSASAGLQDIPEHTEDDQTSTEKESAEEQTEVGDRTFLKPPEGSADAQASKQDPSGLFGGSLHDTDSNPTREVDSDVLSHKPKTIQPLDTHKEIAQRRAEEAVTDSPLELLPSPEPDPAKPTQYEPPNNRVPLSVEPDSKQQGGAGVDTPETLEDIERAVHSPHLAGNSNTQTSVSENRVNDFLGGSAQPPPAEEASKPAELPSLPQAPKAEAPKQPESAAAKVENPTAAPAVPPPLMPMPQASSNQPQFFEADGSKSNPFTQS